MFLQPHQEGHRLLAVDDAVIVGERQIHHRPDLDLAVHRHRTLHDVVHAQNARLRRVQDRRRHQRAVGAAVGDGEGAALHLVHGQGAVARRLAQGRDALLNARQRQRVGVAQHRHDQALVGADSDADVVVVLVDDVRAVDLGVDGRDFLQRGDHGLGEEAHEAELGAMALFEGFLVLAAQRHHRRHVHLVEGGQLGGRVLRLFQATGDGLTQARHLHPLFARSQVARRGGCGGRGLRHGLRGLTDGGQGVGLGDVALWTRRLDRLGIEVVFAHHALHRRGQGGVLRGRDLGRAGVGGSRRLGRRRGRAAVAGVRAEAADGGDGLARSNGGALIDRDGQHAVSRRRHLDRDLVGLDLDQQLVLLDGVAALLGPLADGALGDAFAHGRHRHRQALARPAGRHGGVRPHRLVRLGSLGLGGRSRLRRLGSRRRCGARAAFGHHAQHRARRHRVALGELDFAQHAVGRGHDLEGDLVGLQLDQHLVLLHRLARLLGPLGDSGFGDGFTKGRGQDVGHVGSSCALVVQS